MNLPVQHIIIVVTLFLTSCSGRNSTNKDNLPDSAIETSKHTVNHNFSSQNHLEVVKHFASSFQPDSLPYRGIGKLGSIPDSVIYAFKALRHSDSISHERYLTVIFLKLYLDHLRCCHQSYEVRNKIGGSIDSLADPLLYEYNLATGLFNVNNPIEFVSSHIGDTYVEMNSHLAKYPDIKELLNKMKPVKDSIEKHLYW